MKDTVIRDWNSKVQILMNSRIGIAQSATLSVHDILYHHDLAAIR